MRTGKGPRLARRGSCYGELGDLRAGGAAGGAKARLESDGVGGIVDSDGRGSGNVSRVLRWGGRIASGGAATTATTTATAAAAAAAAAA